MCSAASKMHCTVRGNLELNEQANNEDKAINYWRM